MVGSSKSVTLFLIALILLQSCGKKTVSTQVQDSFSTANLTIIGSAKTKEIIINTNKFENHSTFKVSGNNQNENSNSAVVVDTEILKKINKARENEIFISRSNTKSDDLIKSEYLIDAASGIAVVGAAATGIGSLGVGLIAVGTTLGSSALKGFVQDTRKTQLETAIEKATDRRDHEILNYSISKSNEYSDSLLKRVSAGQSPEVIKGELLKYKKDLAKDANLEVSEIETIINNIDSNLIFGMALDLKTQTKTNLASASNIAKGIQNQNQLLKSISKSTESLINNQNEVFEKIEKYLKPDERELFKAALFDSSDLRSKKESILAPESLAFFKNHPDKIVEYKNFLKNNDVKTLMNIAAIQEKAQVSSQQLKVGIQIANNLNLDENVLNALSKGVSISDSISSIASFMITSNPLDALNAVSAISSLFSKPKPDPRFTAIFENFKAIREQLVEINKHLVGIDQRLVNIESNLDIIIAQNESLSSFLIERLSAGKFRCDNVDEIISAIPKEELTFSRIESEIKQNRQGNSEKLNKCLSYLTETFENPFKENSAFFNNDLTQLGIIDDPADAYESQSSFEYDNEITSFVQAKNRLKQSYNLMKTYYPKASSTGRLLSVETIAASIKRLIRNSYLFDIAFYDNERNGWKIVNRNELNYNIKENKKTDLLLRRGIQLVEASLVQQSIIDGVILNDKLISNFINEKNVNCSGQKIDYLTCAAENNSILRKNLVLKTLQNQIKYEYYLSWFQVAKNNPDFINEKLKDTPLRIVWVGDGASSLFKGEKINSSSSYKDGAYFKIGSNSKLISIPNPEELKQDNPPVVSERIKLLTEYKKVLQNELIERNIDQVLSKEELNSFNQFKIKNINL